VDWPSYLRAVVTTASGAAAGAAAVAGGPVAAATAKAIAEKVTGDLLNQFMEAQSDQAARTDALIAQITGRLDELYSAVGAQLDTAWHKALTHISEAERRPTQRDRELDLARVDLLEAWSIASALLERDPTSKDPAALRRPQVAQQLAAVYALLAEPDSTRYWLSTGYAASRDQLQRQVSSVYDVLVAKMKTAKDSRKRSGDPCLKIEVWSKVPRSTDRLWTMSPGNVIAPFSYDERSPWTTYGLVRRDLDFETRIAALARFDGESQLLRQTCAEVNVTARTGTSDAGVHSVMNPTWSGGRGVVVVFSPDTAAAVSALDGGPQSPLARSLEDRYRSVPAYRFERKPDKSYLALPCPARGSGRSLALAMILAGPHGRPGVGETTVTPT
jgi:hypothetical protein